MRPPGSRRELKSLDRCENSRVTIVWRTKGGKRGDRDLSPTWSACRTWGSTGARGHTFRVAIHRTIDILQTSCHQKMSRRSISGIGEGVIRGNGKRIGAHLEQDHLRESVHRSVWSEMMTLWATCQGWIKADKTLTHLSFLWRYERKPRLVSFPMFSRAVFCLARFLDDQFTFLEDEHPTILDQVLPL